MISFFIHFVGHVIVAKDLYTRSRNRNRNRNRNRKGNENDIVIVIAIRMIIKFDI